MTTWHPVENQISLQHSRRDVDDQWYSGVGSTWEQVDGRWRVTQLDDDIMHVNDGVKGTYFEYIINSMPFKPLRTRLMRMPAKRCYSVHRDATSRWHIAIKTTTHALFVFTQDQLVTHIPADGHAYYVDTTREHTALNGDTEERIHLVMLDPRHALPQDEMDQYKW